jgi:hypothetical protein
VTTIGDYKVDFLGDYTSILKKALIRVSGALGKLFDEKSQRSKISCQGPFKRLFMFEIMPKYITFNTFRTDGNFYENFEKNIC